MRAFTRTYANTGEVKLVERPSPKPGDHDVLVAMRAFGVGIHDRYFIPPGGPFPYTIGTEGAGVVMATGNAVTALGVGDRVMMTTIMQPQGGTWAELAIAPEKAVRRIPEALDFATTAGIPIAGDAAVETLHTLALPSGSTLFLAGGSGAIGTLLIQMATRRGIRIAASASAANHDFMRSLGAELAVDYRDPSWPDHVKQWAPGGVDAALSILPGIARGCLAVVRDGGHLVTVSGDSDSVPSERGIRVEQFQHRPNVGADMAKLVDDIAAGHVRLVLERVYDFEDAVAALDKTETRHARGKRVVRVPSAQ
jgi:NADPH:quinone reductase-like Zn-dependent oxidoreductase